MDREPASLDFAVIGHAADWAGALGLVEVLRSPDLPPLDQQDLRELYPWIPPRVVSKLSVYSPVTERVLRGAYIDTFILPDQLTPQFLLANVKRVRQAAELAIRSGARIVGLGGFSSILCEGRPSLLPDSDQSVFTTGNTLTTAFVVKGIEQALQRLGRELSECCVMIIGSTGDIGSGCVNYLASKSRSLMLHARELPRLLEQKGQLAKQNVKSEVVTEIQSALTRADVVICAASMPEPSISMALCRADALVCDVGYPRNVISGHETGLRRMFMGGIGQLRGELVVQPDIRCAMGNMPLPSLAPGCLMEPVLLALAGRLEPFSRGRGNITTDRIEEVWGMAQQHGFTVAPFFDHQGLWDVSPANDSFSLRP